MVFRSRRKNFLRPINRIKHVVDSQFATIIDTVADTVLVQAIDTPTLADVDGVETGSTVNGIYLKVEVVSNSETGVLPNAYIMIFKNPGGNLTFPKPNVVGGDDNKKYVLHQEMLMLDSDQLSTTHIPRIVFNGVIAIPRHLKRFAPNDNLVLRAFTPGITALWCMQCHYKEFR